ncbi:MAG TPA: hypothetical protein VFQ61_28780 [Polyangiaceae bacterium]|nr:hypothetical protein [Polyangiaceae bacterium]
MRALTPLEAAFGIALAGSVLAVVIPSFVRNLHASYVSEATTGVAELAARTAARLEAAQTTSSLPESAPLTPSNVPRGVRVRDPEGTWEHPTWRALEFKFSVPHAYSFAFDAESAPDVAKFKVTAHGDLDGDAVLSTIAIDGTFKPGAAPSLSAMDVQHEIE